MLWAESEIKQDSVYERLCFKMGCKPYLKEIRTSYLNILKILCETNLSKSTYNTFFFLNNNLTLRRLW